MGSYKIFFLLSVVSTVVFLYRTVLAFSLIPTKEQQRQKARAIFGRRIYTGDRNAGEELIEYFSTMPRLYRNFAINCGATIILIALSKYFFWSTFAVLSPWVFFSSVMMIFFAFAYLIMAITLMYKATKELIEDEYSFLMQYLY